MVEKLSANIDALCDACGSIMEQEGSKKAKSHPRRFYEVQSEDQRKQMAVNFNVVRIRMSNVTEAAVDPCHTWKSGLAKNVKSVLDDSAAGSSPRPHDC
jgi:hypothetical protein